MQEKKFLPENRKNPSIGESRRDVTKEKKCVALRGPFSKIIQSKA